MVRITIAIIPHHVTQRGNAGQFLLSTDAEKNVRTSPKVLAPRLGRALGILPHVQPVHPILVPGEPDAFAVAGETNSRTLLIDLECDTSFQCETGDETRGHI